MSSVKAAPSSHLACPPSLRSRSSGSSTSSLSSTFSDITSSTSASSSSPPNLKTNAFFASPFSTRPPSPTLPSPPPAPPKPRSLTEEFFATPIQPPSPPANSAFATKPNAIHPSRIFPSRYTSILHRSPDFNLLNFDAINEAPSFHSHQRAPSTGSESSFTSSFVEARLPTPPPSATPPRRMPHRDDTITPSDSFTTEDATEEPTPRPADLQPNLLRFERSLLFARQNIKQAPEPPPEPSEDDQVEDEEPYPGSVISLPSPDFPLSPLSLTFSSPSPSPTSQGFSRGTPTPTNDPSIPGMQTPSSSEIPSQISALTVLSILNSNTESSLSSPLSLSADTAESTLQKDHTQVPRLRLLKPLGHGAFSAVWLAEDLSRVPLTLVSKKSVRDLRRRASGRERERQLEKRKDRSAIEPAIPDASKLQGDDAPKTDTSVRRPPSRLREGLKNMLSFSRSSTAPCPQPANSPKTTDLTLSRTSSAKSDGSEASLSRTSSISSSSRNSSLRIHLQQDMTLSRDSSLKKFRDRVRGTRPAFLLGRAYLDERHGEMGEPRDNEDPGDPAGRRDEDVTGVAAEDGEGVGLGASLSRHSSLGNNASYGRLVAVKMTPRKTPGPKGRERAEEERTRVGFVREVEVLKHISHPNITPLLAHLSTSSHHILVLPYLPGGDLLGLVNNDVAWGMLGETVLRRIWCELCKAVGWMHGVGLVHRDIKLENILLTTPAFSSLTTSSPRPTLASLPSPPAPFIKLTDFGLSRFVEIDANGDAELLSTRCGSEAYAAPELVTGGGGDPSGRGVYDARKTDAWACGVVLYALVGRQLPFGEGVGGGGAQEGPGSKIGGERGGQKATQADRRHWLMRIANGHWEWPGDEAGAGEAQEHVEPGVEEELVGPCLVKSRGARRVVGRLLVRDPRKRARIGDLWDDMWMQGGEDQTWWKQRIMEESGGGDGDGEHRDLLARDRDILMGDGREEEEEEEEWGFDEDGERRLRDDDEVNEADGGFYDEPLAMDLPGGGLYHDRGGVDEEEGEEEEEDLEEEGGCLLDQEGIDSITRQEVI